MALLHFDCVSFVFFGADDERRTEVGLNKVARYPDSPVNRINYALVAGFGFAFMSSMVLYVTYLAETLSSGVILCTSCSSVPFPFVGAWSCMIFSLLHVMWGFVGFEGYKLGLKDKQGLFRIGLVVLGHFGASFATLFIPSTIPYGCIYGNLIPLTLLIATAYIAWIDTIPVLTWKAPEGEDQLAAAESRMRARHRSNYLSADLQEDALRRRTAQAPVSE